MRNILEKESRLYQEGLKDGYKESMARIVIRFLSKQFGELSEDVRADIRARSLPVLEALTDELLDFSSLSEVQAWLAAKPQS
jgi:hypothetical protein